MNKYHIDYFRKRKQIGGNKSILDMDYPCNIYIFDNTYTSSQDYLTKNTNVNYDEKIKTIKDLLNSIAKGDDLSKVLFIKFIQRKELIKGLIEMKETDIDNIKNLDKTKSILKIIRQIIMSDKSLNKIYEENGFSYTGEDLFYFDEKCSDKKEDESFEDEKTKKEDESFEDEKTKKEDEKTKKEDESFEDEKTKKEDEKVWLILGGDTDSKIYWDKYFEGKDIRWEGLRFDDYEKDTRKNVIKNKDGKIIEDLLPKYVPNFNEVNTLDKLEDNYYDVIIFDKATQHHTVWKKEHLETIYKKLKIHGKLYLNIYPIRKSIIRYNDETNIELLTKKKEMFEKSLKNDEFNITILPYYFYNKDEVHMFAIRLLNKNKKFFKKLFGDENVESITDKILYNVFNDEHLTYNFYKITKNK